MSILARLLRLRIPFAPNAKIDAGMLASGGASPPTRRKPEALPNGRASSAAGKIAEFSRPKAYSRSPVRASGRHSSPAWLAVGSEIADADLVRFRSDLESMLASLDVVPLVAQMKPGRDLAIGMRIHCDPDWTIVVNGSA